MTDIMVLLFGRVTLRRAKAPFAALACDQASPTPTRRATYWNDVEAGDELDCEFSGDETHSLVPKRSPAWACGNNASQTGTDGGCASVRSASATA